MSRKHILIPIDRSRFSQKILPHLDLLGASGSYKLTLLYVAREVTSYDVPRKDEGTWDNIAAANRIESVTYEEQPVYASQIEESVRDRVETDLVPVRKALTDAGYEVDIVVRFEKNAVEEIVRFAEEEEVDLVAMATRGRKGLRRRIVGGIFRQVLDQIHIPMLVIHPPRRNEPASSPKGD
ncbi:MAG: universal stress protein [Chloroflexota bacterium]|jgi:nucleotide-binding universal stress UspA family protein|nr:MAG: universal stress protein [Chloroflexota bacterium]